MRSIESLGLQPTGRVQQLNSYENRVYDVWLEGGDRTILKFYRPERWSQDAIKEEHQFLEDLHAEGLPTSRAIPFRGQTLHTAEGLHFSLFERISGRSPDELTENDAEAVGRRLALLHSVGARRRADNRPDLTVQGYGEPALDALEQYLVPELNNRYLDLAEELLDLIDDRIDPSQFIRIHGDCHRGNLMFGRGVAPAQNQLLKAGFADAVSIDQGDFGSTPEQFFFIDLDDFVNGPVAQDFWMLLPAEQDGRDEFWDKMVVGYESLRRMPDDVEELFEPLRGLRMIHYSGWIARRWRDPSFPRLFPEFGSYLYWLEECDSLEQLLRKLTS